VINGIPIGNAGTALLEGKQIRFLRYEIDGEKAVIVSLGCVRKPLKDGKSPCTSVRFK